MLGENLGLVKILFLVKGYYKIYRIKIIIKSRCIVIFRISCESLGQNRVGVNFKRVKV